MFCLKFPTRLKKLSPPLQSSESPLAWPCMYGNAAPGRVGSYAPGPCSGPCWCKPQNQKNNKIRKHATTNQKNTPKFKRKHKSQHKQYKNWPRGPARPPKGSQRASKGPNNVPKLPINRHPSPPKTPPRVSTHSRGSSWGFTL